MSDSLATLVVKLEAETAKYQKELQTAKSKLLSFEKDSNAAVKNIAKGVGLAAVAAATGLGVMIKSSIDAADALSKLSQKSGISTETLSELGYAAGLSGVETEELSKALNKLAKTSVEAAEGGKVQADAFKAFGVSVTDATGKVKKGDDLILELAESFSKMEDGPLKAAKAQDIFGKSGANLIALLNLGADGIQKLRDEAVKFGVSISADVGKNAEQFNDNLTRMKTATIGIANELAARLLPTLVDLSDAFIAVVKESDTLVAIADVIVFTFRLLATPLIVIKDILYEVITAIISVGDALINLLKGNFKDAFNSLQIGGEQMVDGFNSSVDTLTKLWATGGKKIVNDAEKTADKLTEIFVIGDNSIKEIEIKLKIRTDLTPMETVFKEFDDLTISSSEKTMASYYRQIEALKELSNARKIDGDTYEKRLKEINQALDDATGVTKRQDEALQRAKSAADEGKQIFEATRTPLEKYNHELVKLNILLSKGAIDQDTYNRAVANSQDAFDKASKGSEEFFIKFKENAQDILGQGIYDSLKDGFDKGASAALVSFSDMLLRMATEALAADIMGSLFGTTKGANASSGSDSGGALSSIVGAVAGMFGGSRDSGGKGSPGVAYAIGVGAQPEMFVPDQPGKFIPRDQWMNNGNTIVQTFNIEAPKGTVSRQTQMQIGASASKSLQNANRRNN